MALNRRLTLFLAFVLAALLGFSLFVNATRVQVIRDHADQFTLTPVTPQAGFLFPSVEPALIAKIVIRDAKGTQVTFVKVPGDWQATNGLGTPQPTDLANLTRVIQILGTLRYNRVLADSNLSSYGLTGEGNVSIQFETSPMANAPAISHRLKIGITAQVSGFTYVMRDQDSAIYLAPTQPLEALTALLASPTPPP